VATDAVVDEAALVEPDRNQDAASEAVIVRIYHEDFVSRLI
jgi:hypothetical protein